MDTPKDLALYSIKPEFARAILDGEKTVEFRRNRPQRDVSQMVIYSTSPQSRVVGIADIVCIVFGSIDEIWEKYSDVGGISRQGFYDYFKGTNIAYAIEIGKVHSLDQPKELRVLGIGDRPPQSFRYLPNLGEIFTS
jgi:type I restriction enzyme, S subunit